MSTRIRIGEELLRVDRAHHIFGLRLNLYVASVLCIAGIVWFVRIQRAGARSSTAATVRRGGVLLAAAGLLMLAGCGDGSHRLSACVSVAPQARAGAFSHWV